MAAARSSQNISFFRDLRQRACRNGIQSVAVEDEQRRIVGLILFDGCLNEEKIKEIATKIGSDPNCQPNSPVCPAPEQDPQPPPQESCQVTVEERAQLFAFLNN